ncbi:diacylglycerol kinase family protein [Streptomyces spectabilis]|uniref:DAGKc domain-containing protein n=1 Tax=Streptomyces spectabilis TaxID=68270 RepID=A0A516R197_STRST|nr:diacylglycerol kinase family protein [Streptomyces spectabilis]QDQ09422.1 hypothetical protein FH965_01615 [Streptomyces spectabilis]
MRTHEPRPGERTDPASLATKNLTGNRSMRRAALRGTGSLALASAAIQVATKVLDQRRPLRHPPSGMPSSRRTAGAAAFATAATLETPRLGIVLIPLAAGIAAARALSGAHAPTRILADTVLGVGVAAATCHWWPLHHNAPANSAPPQLPVPALPSGEGLVMVVNSNAGGEVPAEVELRTLLPKADVRLCEAGEDLHTALRQAAAQAQARGGALGVVGGDGTVNAAATQAVDNGEASPAADTLVLDKRSHALTVYLPASR